MLDTISAEALMSIEVEMFTIVEEVEDVSWSREKMIGTMWTMVEVTVETMERRFGHVSNGYFSNCRCRMSSKVAKPDKGNIYMIYTDTSG